MEAKYLVVSLEGNIGAGKSTLFQLMREEFPEAIFLEEPLEEWQAVKGDPRLNMLEQFYAEPRRWSFTFQVHCIQSKLRAWDREIKARERKDGEVQVVFTERSIESARAVFFRNCHEKGLLNQLEHAIYEEYYAWLTEHFRKYAVGSVVYVKTPVQECFKVRACWLTLAAAQEACALGGGRSPARVPAAAGDQARGVAGRLPAQGHRGRRHRELPHRRSRPGPRQAAAQALPRRSRLTLFISSSCSTSGSTS